MAGKGKEGRIASRVEFKVGRQKVNSNSYVLLWIRLKYVFFIFLLLPTLISMILMSPISYSTRLEFMMHR